MLRVFAIKILNGAQKAAAFHTLTTRKNLPEISLSRIPDHCYYSIDRLQEHDFHTPAFSTDEEVEEYIERVRKDIEKALDGKNLEDFPVNDEVSVTEIYSTD